MNEMLNKSVEQAEIEKIEKISCFRIHVLHKTQVLQQLFNSLPGKELKTVSDYKCRI